MRYPCTIDGCTQLATHAVWTTASGPWAAENLCPFHSAAFVEWVNDTQPPSVNVRWVELDTTGPGLPKVTRTSGAGRLLGWLVPIGLGAILIGCQASAARGR